MLVNELNFFIKNQEELVRKYRGKTLVIQGDKIIATYDHHAEAYFETIKTHAPGTFAIQRCEPGPEAYTVTIQSAVFQQTAYVTQ